MPTFTRRIYTQESQLRHPRALFRMMLADAWAGRGLAWRLFMRDLASRYRQTFFGYFWAVMPAVVTGGTFVLLQSSNIVTAPDGDIPYPVFVFVGTTFYSIFAEAVSAPVKAVAQSRAILIRVDFPREALVMTGILNSLFVFVINLGLLAVILAVTGTAPSAGALFAVIPLFGLLIAGTAIGILLAPISALYQDIALGINILTFGIVFMTPVAYERAESGLLAQINGLNPLTPLIESARALFLGTGSTDLLTTGLIIAAGTVLLGIFWLFMRLAMPLVIERMGS